MSTTPKFLPGIRVRSRKHFVEHRLRITHLAIGLLLGLMLSLPIAAQTVTLHLTRDLSSKMATGTPFEARDDSGKIYHGHLITHRARRMMRNGSMLLVFDEPVKPVTRDLEGAYRGGNKVRLLKLGGSLGLAKLADDSVDGTIGATKARYVGASVALAFLLLTKGEEARLHAGDTIEVSPGR